MLNTCPQYHKNTSRKNLVKFDRKDFDESVYEEINKSCTSQNEYDFPKETNGVFKNEIITLEKNGGKTCYEFIPHDLSDDLMEMLPKCKSSIVWVIGELGSCKSSILNYYLFGDLIVVHNGPNFVVDITEEQKAKLKGECVIFHKYFMNYIGEIFEQLKNENLTLYELHVNLEKKKLFYFRCT